ncbi:hypothetical protein GCM10023187_23860 [Nibrella viscosa]|uniref:PepSY-associated TM region n=1 Tax=Nibrella viscosa TaxID=1084524 RepID=A0ABP8KEP6_9BACT
MASRNWHRRIRKSHRYLGLFIGIQFLAWTVGGLYFSWTNIDEIHGDHQKNHSRQLTLQQPLASPAPALSRINGDSLTDIRLITVLDRPTYQITYTVNHSGHPMKHVRLADALTGDLRPGLTRAEAVALAKRHFNGSEPVERILYLTTTDGHHEYREKPLPAYAVTFANSSHTTVYVAPQLGQVTSFRHDGWRWFDWLWMLHTMDYEGRDNINNYLLRGFSVLGLFTVLSGFCLYFVSSTRFRLKPKGRKAVKSLV